MEYHNDRFQDFSLLIFDEKDNLKAILPANRFDNTVFSHQGLTYGGLVVHNKTKLSDIISIFQAVLKFLNTQNILTLEIKTLPSIYSQYPSDELEYLAFVSEAELVRRDTLSVLDLTNDLNYTTDRKQALQKSLKNNLKVKEEATFEAFWDEILIPNLAEKHQAKPVHSMSEITFLKGNFPKKYSTV